MRWIPFLLVVGIISGPPAAAHGPDQVAALQPQQRFKLRRHIEKLNHRGRMAILQDAETCLEGVSDLEGLRRCEQRERQARRTLRSKLRARARQLHRRYSQRSSFSGRTTATAAARPAG
ncbi:MAG: hypothetical protein DBW85_05010 [Synechococcus sp. MED-G71]|nr:MAG: hypothetical protein DBW85_05010 [Synechococcus sp. MED-G71]